MYNIIGQNAGNYVSEFYLLDIQFLYNCFHIITDNCLISICTCS